MALFDAIAGGVGAIAGAGASIYGAEAAANAAKKAGNLTYAQWLQSRKDYMPWLKSGQGAIGKLSDIILGGQGNEYMETPGYKFRFNEGVRALDNSASARGMVESGPEMKALLQYGQDYGTGEYDARLNRLGTLAGFGSEALGRSSVLGANAAATRGGYLADAGAIRGTSYANAANTLLGGAQNAYKGYYA